MKLCIKKYRDSKNLTLDELAKLTKSSKSYIWELENNPNANPSYKKMFEISKALKVSMDSLIE